MFVYIQRFTCLTDGDFGVYSLCDVTPCSLAHVYCRFGGTCFLCNRDRRVAIARKNAIRSLTVLENTIYTSALVIAVECSCVTSVHIYQITQRYFHLQLMAP